MKDLADKPDSLNDIFIGYAAIACARDEWKKLKREYKKPIPFEIIDMKSQGGYRCMEIRGKNIPKDGISYWIAFPEKKLRRTSLNIGDIIAPKFVEDRRSRRLQISIGNLIDDPTETKKPFLLDSFEAFSSGLYDNKALKDRIVQRQRSMYGSINNK